MPEKLKILDMKGDSVGEFALKDEWLELKKGEQAVHDVVVASLSAQRAGTASTKTRGEVRGGGAKPFRQKGTGRARAGSIRSPLWRGGGVAFGPKPRSFAKKVNKKVRTLALKRAFSERIKEGSVVLINAIDLPDHKTKNIEAALKKLNLGKSVLMIVRDYSDNLLRATANIPEVQPVKAASASVYQLLRFKKILFTKDAMDEFIQRLA